LDGGSSQIYTDKIHGGSPFLSKRIFRGIADAGGVIVADILHRDADVFEYFIQRFSEMAEGYGSVMGEVAFDQYMAVEPAHLRDGKYADGTKGAGCHGKYFAVSNVSPQTAVGGTLQAEESDVAGDDIAFQCTLGHLLGKGAGHDQLIAHLTEGKFLGGGIAAVESHESIL